MDGNKIIRAGIVLGLMSLAGYGAHVVMEAFKSPANNVATNNDPVDFSGPAAKKNFGQRKPSSIPDSKTAPNARGGGRSYGSDSPSIDTARTDGISGGSGSADFSEGFVSSGDQSEVPLQNASNAGSSSGDNGSSDGKRSPASTDSGGSSSGGIINNLGSLLGLGSSTNSGGSSSSNNNNGGYVPSPSPGIPLPTPGISAGTTGGGGFVGQTANNYRASVSIGVPLSGVTGPTSGGYRYQVNLSGQQAQ